MGNIIGCQKYNHKRDDEEIIEPAPLTIDQKLIILKQEKTSLCKIYTKHFIASGFLCLIPFPVLITNDHIFDREELKIDKEIKLTFNDDEIHKLIKLDKKRIVYSVRKLKNQLIDTTIIEIRPKEDNLCTHKFLKIDDNLNNKIDVIKNYKNKDIYLIHYKSPQSSYSTGSIINLIKFDEMYEIEHTCMIDNTRSSGSPIILYNHKVIGVNREKGDEKNYNKGVFLKFPIEEYINKYNISKNKIFMILKIKEEQVDKKVYFLNSNGNNNYLNALNEKNTTLYINNKKEEYKNFFVPKRVGVYKIRLIFQINLTNCDSMFCDCEHIIYINLSLLNSVNITNTANMFKGCDNLNKIDLSEFNTQKITNMENMFSGCDNLEKIDISSFDTSSVINMENMFGGCAKLTNINLNFFDTHNVINMGHMFEGCRKLTSIDLSSFNTTKVVLMNYMFSGCVNLKNVDLYFFDTKNVTNMEYMFSGCINLTNLDLSNFNTKNVLNMGNMFSYSNNLKNIDISGFDVENVRNMTDIFYDCKRLNKIKINRYSYNKIAVRVPPIIKIIDI